MPERKERGRWIKARECHISDQCNRLCFPTACSFGAGCISGSLVQTTYKYGRLKSMTCFIQQWKSHEQGMILLLGCFYSAISLKQGQGTAVQFRSSWTHSLVHIHNTQTHNSVHKAVGSPTVLTLYGWQPPWLEKFCFEMRTWLGWETQDLIQRN